MQTFPSARQVHLIARVACSTFALAHFGALAQDSVQKSASTPSESTILELVRVSGSRESASAAEPLAKYVVTSGEIARFSDSALSDVIRRIPGVLVTEDRGRQSEVRLMGMSGGYTQLLINGKPAPPNFSIDGIPPQTVERIEVTRGALAEAGGRGIAGALNIVLKGAERSDAREATLITRAGRGSSLIAATGSLGTSSPKESQSIVLSAKREHVLQDAAALDRVTVDGGSGAWITQHRARYSISELTVVPSRRTTFDAGSLLLLEGSATLSRQQRPYEDRVEVVGSPPTLPQDVEAQSSLYRLFATLGITHRTSANVPGASIETKLGVIYSQRNTETLSLNSDDASSSPRRLAYPSLDIGGTAAFKYSLSIDGVHALALGLDAASTRRKEEDTVEDESGVKSTMAKAGVNRVAMYVQDELLLSKPLSLYFGIRGEQVRIQSDTDVDSLRNTVDWFILPSVRLTWHPEGSVVDSYRLGISTSNKLPETHNLTSRRFYYSSNNSALGPDMAGNPNLPIERSLNFDASAQARLASVGDVSASISWRRIRDATSVLLAQGADGRWVSMPAVGGDAQVLAIDASHKTTVRVAGDFLQLSSSVSRNWSRASWVTHSALPETVPLSATLLAEYSMAASTSKIAASLSYQAGAGSSQTPELWAYRDSRTVIDLVWSKKMSQGVDFRLAVGNVTNEATRTSSTYQGLTRYEAESVVLASVRTYRFSISLKL